MPRVIGCVRRFLCQNRMCCPCCPPVADVLAFVFVCQLDSKSQGIASVLAAGGARVYLSPQTKPTEIPSVLLC